MSELNAREVGTVGVRAIPLTGRFRSRLLADLRRIEKTVEFRVDVVIDRVRLNRTKVRASLQQQLARLDGLSVDVNAKVDSSQIAERLRQATRTDIRPVLDEHLVTRLRRDLDQSLRRLEVTVRPTVDDDVLRQQIHQWNAQFDALSHRLAHDIMSPADASALRHRLNDIKDHIDKVARDRETRIDANPFTAWAAARLSWLTRPRTVEIIPQVSKAAAAKAATALAALSGARLSYDYMKRFADWMADIDKKLPRLAFGATGVATAFAGIMGSISGIVGIGDGLAATLPSLLLLPGLFAGAAMSGVALFVALRHAKEELDELGPSYTKLGKIIREAFWEDARPAIIDLSNSIMPQLERSFEKTSRAIGRFTANLSRSFKREFAGGRLEAMFDGLTQSWDNLSKGTDAFAGAVTNLGIVAARYMPRLADWFVRQANTFDNWLSKVSTDGRLAEMIEESIDAYYALWDVAAATTGILQGLWKAAEAGGGGGLRGFADMLLRWEKAIQGARWQRTLTAMFKGSGVALDGFGQGLERVGRMLDTQRHNIEYFVGTAGKALGGFIGDLADALARPGFGRGMTEFIDGIAKGLKGLKPALGPVSDMLGELLGFIGDLGASLGNVLGTVGAEIAPGIERMLEKVRPKLDDLGKAFSDAFKGVDWESLGDQAGDLLAGLLDVATELAPLLGDVVELVEDIGLLEGFANLANDASNTLGVLKDIVDLLKNDLNADSFDDGAEKITGFLDILTTALGPAALPLKPVLDHFKELEGVPAALDEAWASVPGWWESVTAGFEDFLTDFSRGMENFGSAHETTFEQIETGFETFKGWLDEFFADPQAWLTEKGAGIVTGLLSGLEERFPGVTSFVGTWKGQIDSFLGDPAGWLISKGASLITGFLAGIRERFPGVTSFVSTIRGQIESFLGDPIGWLFDSGRSVIQGFINGIESMVESAVNAVQSALTRVRANFPFSPAKEGPFSGRGWVSYSGASVGEAFGASIAESVRAQRSKVAAELAHMRNEFTGLTVNAAGSLAAASSRRTQPGDGVVMQAEVNVNTWERDPHRIGREVTRGMVEALGPLQLG